MFSPQGTAGFPIAAAASGPAKAHRPPDERWTCDQARALWQAHLRAWPSGPEGANICRRPGQRHLRLRSRLPVTTIGPHQPQPAFGMFSGLSASWPPGFSSSSRSSPGIRPGSMFLRGGRFRMQRGLPGSCGPLSWSAARRSGFALRVIQGVVLRAVLPGMPVREWPALASVVFGRPGANARAKLEQLASDRSDKLACGLGNARLCSAPLQRRPRRKKRLPSLACRFGRWPDEARSLLQRRSPHRRIVPVAHVESAGARPSRDRHSGWPPDALQPL